MRAARGILQHGHRWHVRFHALQGVRLESAAQKPLHGHFKHSVRNVPWLGHRGQWCVRVRCKLLQQHNLHPVPGGDPEPLRRNMHGMLAGKLLGPGSAVCTVPRGLLLPECDAQGALPSRSVLPGAVAAASSVRDWPDMRAWIGGRSHVPGWIVLSKPDRAADLPGHRQMPGWSHRPAAVRCIVSGQRLMPGQLLPAVHGIRHPAAGQQ